jgi:hypothetical protein
LTSTACSVPRRLGMLGTPASKDGACDIYSQKRLGLQRIAAGSFSTTDFFPVRYNVERRRRRHLRLLARWRQLVRGGSNEIIRASVVVCSLIRLPRAGHLFELLRRQSLRRVWSVESCDGFGGPCARERGVLSGGLMVPAHARVASDSVFLHAAR